MAISPPNAAPYRITVAFQEEPRLGIIISLNMAKKPIKGFQPLTMVAANQIPRNSAGITCLVQMASKIATNGGSKDRTPKSIANPLLFYLLSQHNSFISFSLGPGSISSGDSPIIT